MFKGKMVSPSNMGDMKAEEQLKISICCPQKIRKGMSAYVAYKVTTKTNLPNFKKNVSSVSRRFSDFLRLHNKLVERHLNLGVVVPPAPESSVVGMNSKISKVESVLLREDFIEKRAAALERYINRTASHPVLRDDPDLLNFLQNESDLPKATNTFAWIGAGVIRFFTRIKEAVNKFIFKLDETDPWFKEKQHYIEELDKKCRKRYSNAGDVMYSIKNVSALDLLDRSTVKLPLRRKDIELCENFSWNYLTSEILNEYIGVIAVIKNAFHRRVKTYRTLMQMQKILNKKKEQLEKIELAETSMNALVFFGASVSRQDIIEWEEKVKRGEEEFINISKTIRKEIEHFEQTVYETLWRYL